MCPEGLPGCYAPGRCTGPWLSVEEDRKACGSVFVESTHLLRPWAESSSPDLLRDTSVPRPVSLTLCLNVPHTCLHISMLCLGNRFPARRTVGRQFLGSLRPSLVPQISQAKSEAGLTVNCHEGCVEPQEGARLPLLCQRRVMGSEGYSRPSVLTFIQPPWCRDPPPIPVPTAMLPLRGCSQPCPDSQAGNAPAGWLSVPG